MAGGGAGYWEPVSVFCRHNRFTADCPICSKGTPLDPGRKTSRRSSGPAGSKPKAQGATPRAFSGSYVSAGPYDDAGGTYEVRLERVPGGLRLAEWDGSGLRRRAPVLAGEDMARLVGRAAEILDERDAARLSQALEAPAGSPEAVHGEAAAGLDAAEAGTLGVSRGRSGDFKEELRLEAVGAGRVRLGRWLLRPGSGWQLQEAPPMLPAARYAEAIAGAARLGLHSGASETGDTARL